MSDHPRGRDAFSVFPPIERRVSDKALCQIPEDPSLDTKEMGDVLGDDVESWLIRGHCQPS